MSLLNACIASGYNGGTYDCAPVPGVLKYLLKWEGKLPVATLLQGDLVSEAMLIAHSKLGKTNASKLVVFPLVHEPTNKKEANTEVKLQDGFTEVTREGLPAWDLKIRTDLYQVTQLRKGNNRRTRYAFVDDKMQLLATFNSDGEVVGRDGKFFTDGIDATTYDKVKGECNVAVQAENAYQTFNLPAVIQLSAAPPFLFASLKDIQLYEKASPTPVALVAGSQATATMTITGIGSNADTINVTVNSENLVITPVAKTSSETTATLLAAKVKDSINAYTSTNGGYTATNTGAVITITAPLSLGDSLNGTTAPVAVIVGGITETDTSFTGGVDAAPARTIFHISGKVPSALAATTLDFYDDYKDSALGTSHSSWTAKTTANVTKSVFEVAPNAAGYFDVTVTASVAGDYILNLAPPEELYGQLVKGIEGLPVIVTIT